MIRPCPHCHWPQPGPHHGFCGLRPGEPFTRANPQPASHVLKVSMRRHAKSFGGAVGRDLDDGADRIETLENALRVVLCSLRTFRNVPKDEQEWTPLDNEAIDNGFKVLGELHVTPSRSHA